MPSQAKIRCECAFTYMNAVFRQNLTESMAVDVNDDHATLDASRALCGATGIALSRRTIVTRTFGVSDPLRAGRGAKKGAAKWGSSRPTVDLLGCNNGVDCDTGGTERRR